MKTNSSNQLKRTGHESRGWHWLACLTVIALPPLALAGASFQGLGFLPNDVSSRAWSVSRDGKIIVGDSGNSDGSKVEVYRWTRESGMQGLGFLQNGYYTSAWGVSSDGRTVAGDATDAAGVEQAFYWTESGGMIGLGALPGGSYSYVYDLSEDGKLVVGAGDGGLSGTF
jgi:probable HAF family extracellular repeat protein